MNESSPWQDNFKGWRVAAVLAVPAFMMGAAGPALAAQVVTGAGAGTGWEYPGELVADCVGPLVGVVENDVIVLDHTGTYTGTNPGGAAVAIYTRPTTVTISIGSHVISPAGVGPSCATPLGPVTFTGASVVGSSGGGSVSCLNQSGTYARVNNVVTFTMQGPCTVAGNTAPAVATVHGNPTVHAITGTMNPCALHSHPECAANPDAGSHLVTTYTAAGATVP